MGYREKVVAYAKSQLGVCEPSGDDQYIREYNRITGSSFAMNAPWCAMFVTCCLRAAGVDESTFPNFASCKVGMDYAKKNNIWYSRLTDHKPKSGEFIMFDWGANGDVNHVGVVKSSTTNTVTVIEGNASGDVADGVYEKTYSLTSKYIKGYIDIPYPEEIADAPSPAPTPVAFVLPFKTTPKTVSAVQKALNSYFKASLIVDGIYGAKTKRALIKAIQSELNASYKRLLAVDGIWGTESKKAFVEVSNGDKSVLVFLVQCTLILSGASITADGIFGKKTLAAVREFQDKNNLVVDGIVGRNTMTKLLK